MPSEKRIAKHFPNVITLLNLVSGCLSIVSAFEGQLEVAGLFIILAGIFDFFDGFTARLIGSYTQLGKELDSLSDVVSFGVAPTFIVYHLMRNAMGLSPSDGIFSGYWLLLVPFIMAAFSSLRLGLFNIDERQTSSFIGLPTPANAFLIAGLVFGLDSSWAGIFRYITSSPWVMVGIILVESFLLVCELPMFSLKIKTLAFSKSYKQFALVIGAIILLIVFSKASLSLIILWYILLSVVFYFTDKIASPKGKSL